MTYYDDLIRMATEKNLDVEQMKKDIEEAAVVMGGISLESVAKSILFAVRDRTATMKQMLQVWEMPHE